MTFYLYEQVSITPEQLIKALQEVQEKWPAGTLHKNNTTCNITVKVGDDHVGMIDLLTAEVDDFTIERDD